MLRCHAMLLHYAIMPAPLCLLLILFSMPLRRHAALMMRDAADAAADDMLTLSLMLSPLRFDATIAPLLMFSLLILRFFAYDFRFR